MGEPDSHSVDAGESLVIVRVFGSNLSEIHFRLKMTTEMSKVKSSYSEHIGVPVTSLRFLFDGKIINDQDTPKLLEMENDDVIEVCHEQIGGYDSV